MDLYGAYERDERSKSLLRAGDELKEEEGEMESGNVTGKQRGLSTVGVGVTVRRGPAVLLDRHSAD